MSDAALPGDELDQFSDMLMPTGRGAGMPDSQTETEPDRVVHGNHPERTPSLPDNTISNTKYTWYNFLPKNIFEQFSLNFNRYFLMIALLQLEPSITPVNPASTWGPLILIFGLSATKALLDDLGRRRQDQNANKTEYTVLSGGIERRVASSSIRVGDVVKLHENEGVPCDLVLLYTSNKSGVCYVQTTNLDGESDLKPRRAHRETQSMGLNGVRGFKGVVECPPPNPDLYEFNARMWTVPAHGVDSHTVPTSQPFSISGDVLLQQGIVVRNTEFAYGIATYTGNQTKFGNNKSDPPLKLTKTELFLDKVTIGVFILQLVLVGILGVVGETNRVSHGQDMWYLALNGKDPWYEWLIIPARFLLLNSTMIPISLKVTLDICKLYYAKFIHCDPMLYDPETNEDTVANNTSISEDLGQTEYILTDKTGTLTQNVMVFKLCSIGEAAYSAKDCSTGEPFITAIQDRSNEQIVDYFRNFAINNSVVPTVESGNVVYKGSSPDEIALVDTAARYGVVLTKREGTSVCIEVAGVPEQYTVLQELSFTSARRRMSVIVENEATKEITMYIKGADEVLQSRLEGKHNFFERTAQYLESFAKRGFRTLMYCKRALPRSEFDKWHQTLKKAQVCLGEERKAKVADAYDAIETAFHVQGSSGIEDDLQDLVPETIALLRRADIKFWMLTGDKYSTALQIAKSCKLMSTNTDKTCLVRIHGKDVDEIGDSIYDAMRTLPTRSIRVFESDFEQGDGKEYVVIIEGKDLKGALAENRKDFRKVCMRADTVICCRVSPKQKAELVDLVRSAGKQTLAIGDGGNDVGMIQSAHIGVGIRGKEGLQAARASDYTVPWFKALARLTLVHGRSSYVRTSLIAQYSFYKSFMFCIMQIAFNTLTDYSGTTMFNTASVTAYNAVLFFPIVSFVTWRDLPFSIVLRNPEVYTKGIDGTFFNMKTVVYWFARGLWQGIVLFLVVVLSRGVGYHRAGHGFASDYETLGFAGFITYLWIQAFTMMLEVTALTRRTLCFIWGLHFFTLLVLFVTAKSLMFHGMNEFGAFPMAIRDLQLWSVSILSAAMCVLPVMAWKYVSFVYYTTDTDYLRVKAALGLGKSAGKCNAFALEEEGAERKLPREMDTLGDTHTFSSEGSVDSKDNFIALDDDRNEF